MSDAETHLVEEADGGCGLGIQHIARLVTHHQVQAQDADRGTIQ